MRDSHGARWRDREGLSWIDPFRREAWAFSLGVAEEAALEAGMAEKSAQFLAGGAQVYRPD